MAGIAPRLVGIGLLVVLATAIVLFGARGAEVQASGPVPPTVADSH